MTDWLCFLNLLKTFKKFAKNNFKMWLLFIFVGFSLAAQSPPQIKVMSSNEFHFGSNRNTANVTKISDKSYVVPRGMSGCVLVCTATYPITWQFHNAHFIGHASWMLSVRTRRTAKNLLDLRTYEYMATINIYGNYKRLTGNYTCAHAARSSLQSSIYIFWQDDTHETFIQTNESLTVYVDDNKVILPCVSADPEFKNPVLTKSRVNGNTTELLAYNNSVRFQRRRGIILDNLPYLTGNYTCTPGGNKSNQEFIRINVKRRNESSNSGWVQAEKSNATLTWDPDTLKVKCCASTRRSPVITHYYCNHPSMCDFWKKFVAPDSFNIYSRKKSRKGCTSIKLYVHSGGVVHCVGDGIDRFQQYVFSIRNWALPVQQQKVQTYFDWSEINPHEMILIQMNTYWSYYRSMPPGATVAQVTLYNQQTLHFYCAVSEYYFAEGIRWAIKWKNNTIQIRDVVTSPSNSAYRYEWSNTMFQVTAHVDMESIMCIAPVWNSTEYVYKPYPVYVNESRAPVSDDYLIEESYTWTLNDTGKEISCSAFGIPIPIFSWTKLDDLWHPAHISVLNLTKEIDAVQNISTERILFDRVSYTTNGTYICTALNFGGSVIRKIHIFVQEPSSYKNIVGIIVGVVVSLVLLAAIILVSLKLRSEKRTIHHLSSAVTFKDGNIRPEPPQEAFEPLPDLPGPEVNQSRLDDYSNSTLDPIKLSANLIE